MGLLFPPKHPLWAFPKMDVWNGWTALHLQWQVIPFTRSGHFSFLSLVLSKLFLIRRVTCWWCVTSYEQLANDILFCRRRIRSQASIRAAWWWWSVLCSKKSHKKTLQFAHLWSCNISGLYFTFSAAVSSCFFVIFLKFSFPKVRCKGFPGFVWMWSEVSGWSEGNQKRCFCKVIRSSHKSFPTQMCSRTISLLVVH